MLSGSGFTAGFISGLGAGLAFGRRDISGAVGKSFWTSGVIEVAASGSVVSFGSRTWFGSGCSEGVIVSEGKAAF